MTLAQMVRGGKRPGGRPMPAALVMATPQQKAQWVIWAIQSSSVSTVIDVKMAVHTPHDSNGVRDAIDLRFQNR